VRRITLHHITDCTPAEGTRTACGRHQDVTPNTIYSVAFARPRRDQLSQLMTASQAVDGLLAWFDNADSVE
jgi:hypothetical protein